jgi:heme/copper-type cytochrome/quinol oxidase subunit 2
MRYLIPALLACLVGGPVLAEDVTTIEISIKDHLFNPAEIHVPAGKPVVLKVTNEDATAEEFESSALKVEKVIPGGKSAIVRLRPLKPGQYSFMGEFNPGTAQGVVIAE